MTDVKDSLNSLLDGRRTFDFTKEDETKTVYYIGTPTADDIRKADWEHAKAYNNALKEGVFTSSEMSDILKKRNIVGPDYEASGEALRVLLRDKLVEMEKETDRETQLRLALESAKLRDDVFQWSQRLSGPMSHTCENIANDIRSAYLTSVVVQDEKGNRVWKTFEDYRNEMNLALQTRARFEVMLWMEGLESDFLDKSPENVVMKGIITSIQTEQEDLLKKAQEAAVGGVSMVVPLDVENAPEAPPVALKAPRRKRVKKGEVE